VLFSMQGLLRDSNDSHVSDALVRRQNRCVQQRAFCLLLAILVALAGQAFAASSVTDPNRLQGLDRQKELSARLEELVTLLRQERSAYYAKRSQLEAQTKKAHENREILQAELNDLRRQDTELNQQLQEYEEEVKSLARQLVQKESLEDVLREQIQPFLVNQRAALENGIPYKQQERIGRLEAAVGDVNTPSHLSAADQFGHIWNYAQDELRLARSSETYTARAKTQDESSPYARFFRVGQTNLGYITEDGRQAAIWTSLAGYKNWVIMTDTKQAAQIRSAVDILDRRQGPKLVMLPMALASKSSDEGDADASP